MNAKYLETAKTLVKQCIYETLEKYVGTPKMRIYEWGFCQSSEESFTVGSQHEDCFFYADDVINIARACGCNYLLCVRENVDGKPTPCILVF